MAMARLADGTFLTVRYDDSARQLVERFDPASGSWTPAAPMSRPRELASFAVLPDGPILFAGGIGEDPSGQPNALQASDLYDPAADTWAAGPDLLEGHAGGSLLPLADGSVLLLGGSNTFNTEGEVPSCPAPMTSVERFYPGS
jgi:hypothetical protein